VIKLPQREDVRFWIAEFANSFSGSLALKHEIRPILVVFFLPTFKVMSIAVNWSKHRECSPNSWNEFHVERHGTPRTLKGASAGSGQYFFGRIGPR
jgi:hypothetical protein